MSILLARQRIGSGLFAAFTAFALWMPTNASAQTQIAPFSQAVAEEASKDPALATFYKERDYQPIWTGENDARRREAFLTALAASGEQGLPEASFGRDSLVAAFRDVQTERDRAKLEVRMSETFLDYARDIQTGVLVPEKIDPALVRKVPVRDRLEQINAFVVSDPATFLHELPPQSAEYNRLLKAKLDLEQLISNGGWGPKVTAKSLKKGQSGAAVVQLRDRLVRMGYLAPTAGQDYDDDMAQAISRFQGDHGIDVDGIANPTTVSEINVEPIQRLQSVIVALERERWINMDLGKRHIWVNLADFTAKIYDDNKVTFATKVVVGRNTKDTRSPEFSDFMRFMIVNPTWNVPRSIVTKEYLPEFQKDPNAERQLTLIDARGRPVDRSTVDFSQYTENTFPFALKQPPSDGNALGLVKFMFPNKYNIYLHDTPTKYLFKREVRAFSHGCIRVADPFDLAYTLLSRQTTDPEATFKAALRTRVETIVNLETPVPVHLVYFTAFVTPAGDVNYRRDVYGRDAEIFAALAKAGVELPSVQG